MATTEGAPPDPSDWLMRAKGDDSFFRREAGLLPPEEPVAPTARVPEQGHPVQRLQPLEDQPGIDLRGLNQQERKWVLAVSETEQPKYRDLLLTSKRAARRALHEQGD
jgi:hypothetical protein